MAKDFASFKRDDNFVAIQTGTHFRTNDATGVPQQSPIAIDTNVTTIQIPSDAAEVVFLFSVATKVSEALAMPGYYTQPANIVQAYGVAGMDTMYIAAAAGTGTANFYFVQVKQSA